MTNQSRNTWKKCFHDYYSVFYEIVSFERESDCACWRQLTVRCSIHGVIVTIYRFRWHQLKELLVTFFLLYHRKEISKFSLTSESIIWWTGKLMSKDNCRERFNLLFCCFLVFFSELMCMADEVNFWLPHSGIHLNRHQEKKRILSLVIWEGVTQHMQNCKEKKSNIATRARAWKHDDFE